MIYFEGMIFSLEMSTGIRRTKEKDVMHVKEGEFYLLLRSIGFLFENCAICLICFRFFSFKKFLKT